MQFEQVPEPPPRPAAKPRVVPTRVTENPTEFKPVAVPSPGDLGVTVPVPIPPPDKIGIDPKK